ncbi:granzyme B-like [Arapaima gigas]
MHCPLAGPPMPHTGGAGHGIIGGKESKAHSRPYMTSLQDPPGSHFCGGFLIRKDFVLTAAHCLKISKNILAVLGTNNLKKKEKSKQSIPVQKCYQHPDFWKNNFDFDVMLCKLQNNATLNKNVQPIELPKQGENISDGTQCLVSGWGRKKPKSPAASSLREVSLKIQNSGECAEIWRSHFVPERMICTHFSGKKGICQGDSGGPLVCENKAYGIAAFTGQPCTEIFPNVFMKTSAFVSWIKETMKK